LEKAARVSAGNLKLALPESLFGYPVTGILGRGALSTIYTVKDPKTAQALALKHVVPETEKHLRFIEQLQNEFEISKQFRHPGLRKCIDLRLRKRMLVGKITEAALIMELIEGEPLDRDHPGRLRDVAECFVRAGRAIDSMHLLRVVHCDFKPSNIIRNSQGGVTVIDFGQACPVGTVKKRVQGTPDFIAPEQVKCKPVGIYTDVFNFGATLYWALTDHRVPTLITVDKKSRSIVTEQKYPKPHEINPMVPTDLSETVMACVRVRVDARPYSIADVLRTLEPYTK
jgi:serine/threonine protein kinase